MITRFCRWWLQDELRATRAAGYNEGAADEAWNEQRRKRDGRLLNILMQQRQMAATAKSLANLDPLTRNLANHLRCR